MLLWNKKCVARVMNVFQIEIGEKNIISHQNLDLKNG